MNNMFDIAGKVAVVTGGSGVLGSNIAEGLLKAGAKVIIIGAHQDRVDAALERLKVVSQDVAGTVCNVLDIESLRSVKDTVLSKWGRVDFLINAAGGNIPGGTLTVEQNIFDMKVEDLNKVVDLNLNGTVYPCLVFGEIMAKQQSGVIVNVLWLRALLKTSLAGWLRKWLSSSAKKSVSTLLLLDSLSAIRIVLS